MPDTPTRSHLDDLEAESIHVLREVAAAFLRPVLLYSIGKDSSVLLHLLGKAFAPARPPMPLLHVDTRWKFRDMISFRDRRIAELGWDLRVHINPDGVARGIGPPTHGASVHTDVMKTQALRQALAAGQYDAAIGGARRDEEVSRAKERIFSHRDAHHAWEPRQQRPELWNVYNTRLAVGESMRVFPLSNWTELDVWRYIQREAIDVVPLYFAAERPVVQRDAGMIVVDDGRLPLGEGEIPELRRVRFRSLGCYPLTAAVDSDATDVAGIIAELEASRSGERDGRGIDQDPSASMEAKKREGYF